MESSVETMSVFCAIDWLGFGTEVFGKVLDIAEVCFAEGTSPEDGVHPEKGRGVSGGALRGLDVSDLVVAPRRPSVDSVSACADTPAPPAAPAGPEGLLGSIGSVGFPKVSFG